MRFGVCCPVDEAPSILEAGFDYAELGANHILEHPELYVDVPVEATNLFFPGTIKLFGPEKTPYLDLAKRTVEACARAGVKIMVIGSGASRKAPPGISIVDANRSFTDIAAEISQFAKTLGVTIAPESLTRAETNVGNDLGELATGLKSKGVAYTADIFHVLQEWNHDRSGTASPDWNVQVPHLPAHVHFANLDRFTPTVDDPLALGFLRRLKILGYDDRISFEGNREGYGPEALLNRMKELWATA